MTDQPPPPGNYPPPGGYPPPPASGGGFPPPPQGGFPPPQGGFQPPQGGLPPQMGMPGAALPKESYTPWITRVFAWVLDSIPVFLIEGIAWGILMGTQETVCITDSSEYALGEFCASGASTLGQVTVMFATIVILAYVVWNFGYRQGTTGSSIGKSIMKFKVVSEKTWQPIGFGLSIVRQLAHIIDAAICYIGFLFPLWDAKRQTIADKIMTTVCLPL